MKGIRIVSLLLALVMCLSLLPAAAFAGSVFMADTQQQTVGTELDYDALRQEAYVINPAWEALSPGLSLSYSFRNESFSETYQPQRHFTTFAAAYRSYLDSGRTDTPVFLLAAGTFSEARMTVRGSMILLGANAGISPNASVDLQTADPRGGWAANPERGAESILTNGVSLSSASDDTQLILDGICYRSGTELLSLHDTGMNTVDVVMQNMQLSLTSAQYFVNDQGAADSVNRYDFHNIRSEDSKNCGFYSGNADRVRLDGVYYANSSGNITVVPSAPEEFSFLMQNSYIYQCSAGYNMDFQFTNADHRAAVTLLGNVFYNHNTGS